MAGYIRNDTSNNIADGNIINAADFDGEFDAIQTAFDATNGHKHDGSVGGGAPITVIGPAQDVVASASTLRPKSDDTLSLGTSTQEFKDLWIDGIAHIDNLVVDETATITTDLSVNGNVVLGSDAADTVTFNGKINTSLLPDADVTRDLGSPSLYWDDAYVQNINVIDNVIVGDAGSGVVDVDGVLYSTIITAGSGGEVSLTVNDGYGNANVTFNHTAGTPDQNGSAARIAADVDSTTGKLSLKIADNVSAATPVSASDVAVFTTATSTIKNDLAVDGAATVTGAATFNGNVNLGNATADTINATGRFGTALVPATDDASDLGSSTNEWRDLWIDGTANIDTLVADTASIERTDAIPIITLRRTDASVTDGEVIGRFDFQTLGGAAGGLSNAIVGRIQAYATETFDATNNATAMQFALANDGAVTTRMTLHPDGRLQTSGSIIASANNTQDIGTSANQFKDIYIDGTGYIDALDSEIVNVDNLRFDGNTISSTNTNGNINLTPNGTGNVVAARFDSTSQFLGQSADTEAAPSFTWSGDTVTGIFHPAINTVGITTGGVERVRIDSAGNVGIGTNAPAGKLDVAGSIYGDASIFLRASTTGDSRIEVGTGRSGDGNAYLDLISNATHTDYAMRVFRTAGVNTDGLVSNRGTGTLRVRAVDLGAVSLDTNSTSRVHVTSTGDVGIGNTAPAAKLEVTGDTLATIVTASNQFRAPNTDLPSSPGYSFTGDTNTGMYHIGENTIGFATGNEEAFRITQALQLRFSAAAAGIQFKGDTATANALNDYEEGTWTPVLSDGTNNATSSAASGTYTKVGKLVTVNCNLQTSSLGAIAAGSAVRITGFPFTSDGASGCGMGYVNNFNITAGHSISGRIVGGNTFMNLYRSDATTGYTVLLASEWATTGNVSFSLSYVTSE